MGLLLIRLVEHRRADGRTCRTSRHLLVIEEAHRLLAATGRRPAPRQEGEADARGKAVETFANLLSEIRAYGQGVVVADQVPVKLAPEVVKNTNLKIAHRIVAGDDRHALAGAMAMDDRQARALATLGVGRAAVFADGEDAPLLVDIPRQKGGPGQVWPGAQRLRDQMRRKSVAEVQPELLYPGPDCEQGCAALPSACEFARDLSEDSDVRRTVARVLLSAIYDSGALGRTAPELCSESSARRPRWVDRRDALDRVTLHAARRTQPGWARSVAGPTQTPATSATAHMPCWPRR